MGPVPPPSARLRIGLVPLLCGIAILLATAATTHAASTVTVPFGGGLRKESAIVIARSAARLAALREGLPLLREGSAASFAALAAHDPQRRLAVASAALTTRVISSRVEGYPPEVRVAVTVEAVPPAVTSPVAGSGPNTAGPYISDKDISDKDTSGPNMSGKGTPDEDMPDPALADAPSPAQDAGSDLVRAVLRNEPLLELHEEVLRREASLTEEALDAAQATARHVARHGGDDESPFAQRLGALARSLEALELYRACLSGTAPDGDIPAGDTPAGEASGTSRTAQAAQGGWGLAPSAMLRHMRRAVSLDTRNPLLWNALGEALLLLDRPQDAMEAQDRALRLSPGFARALLARAVCHLRLQLPALAVGDASAAIRLRPDVAAHWRVRGAAWQVRGEPGPMCDDFYRACALGDCEGLRLARGRGQCRPPASAGKGTDTLVGNDQTSPAGQAQQSGLTEQTGPNRQANPDRQAGPGPSEQQTGDTQDVPHPAQDATQDAAMFNEHVPANENPAMLPSGVQNGGNGPARDAGRESSLYELPDDSPAPRTLP